MPLHRVAGGPGFRASGFGLELEQPALRAHEEVRRQLLKFMEAGRQP